MPIYISIDGDDTGNKIASSYFDNSEEQLSRVIKDLNDMLSHLQEYLRNLGFEIIFCAADGIACKGQSIDLEKFSKYLKTVGQPTYTFSAGIGNDLQASYFALKYAKASGKNISVLCEDKRKFKIV